MIRPAYRMGLSWLLGMGLLLWYVTGRLQVANDMTLFLPQEATGPERQVVAMLREGSASRVLLLSLSGAGESELAAASRALAVELSRNPLFVQVSNGSALMAEAERERWFRYRYLLSPVVEQQRFSVPGLRLALESRLEELASPLGALTKPALPYDPLAAFADLLQQWRPSSHVEYRQGVWFSREGKEALLLAITVAGGFDLDSQQQAVAAVRQATASLPQAGQLHLAMSGPGIIGVVTRDTIRSESQWLGLLASLLLALLLWWVYRSLPLLLLSAIPLLSALLVATALTLFLFGTVHGITLAFGMTLLGVAVDYPLHLFSHLRPREPVQQTLQRIWPTLRLGILTTAMGYFAMVFSDFSGLRQLAVFAISGLLTAAAAVRWIVPALLPAAPPLPRSRQDGDTGRRSQAHTSMLFAAVLGVSYLYLSPAPLWQSDLAALSPIPADLRTQDAVLRQQLGVADLRHLLLLRGADAEQVLQRCEALKPQLQRLQAEGVIGPFLLPSDLLPSARLQRQRQVQLPAADELSRRLAEAAQGMPFKPGLFAPFVAAVAQSAALPLLTPDVIATTALGQRLQPMLRQEEGGWSALVQLSTVLRPEELAHWAQGQPAELVYLDIKATTAQMMGRYRNESLIYLLAGGLMITLALRIGLRRWRAVAPVLLPVATALSLTVALLHACGQLLSLFNLMALLLVLGIGIDYGLFFRRQEGGDERQRTAHALALCAISTVSVFGILAFSSIPVLRAIGLTVASGVALAYLLARWGRAHTTTA